MVLPLRSFCRAQLKSSAERLWRSAAVRGGSEATAPAVRCNARFGSVCAATTVDHGPHGEISFLISLNCSLVDLSHKAWPVKVTVDAGGAAACACGRKWQQRRPDRRHTECICADHDPRLKHLWSHPESLEFMLACPPTVSQWLAEFGQSGLSGRLPNDIDVRRRGSERKRSPRPLQRRVSRRCLHRCSCVDFYT
jgi:hypothetical protein